MRLAIALVLGLLVLAAGGIGAWTPSAAAQTVFPPAKTGNMTGEPSPLKLAQTRHAQGLLDLLFGSPRARRPRERLRRPDQRRPDRQYRAPSPTITRPALPKDPDAQRVYVFGDAFASGLATGLTSAFSETPTIEIVGRTKPNSGIVRDDYYDWNAELARILANEDVDIAVVMIGSNDRQAMRMEDRSQESVRSEKWEKTYISRVDALLRQFSEAEIPVYWVGLPIMRPQSYGQDMAYLNEVFLARVQRAGGKFIDTWSRFADEEGRYSAVGPDVSGKIRTLRADNGILMTRTGNKKLAFFVEQVVNADLEAGGLARLSNLGVGEGAEGLRGPVELEVSLTSPETPPTDATLAGAVRPQETDKLTDDPANPRADYRVLVLGESPDPQTGRADDFAWPRGGVAATPEDAEEAIEAEKPDEVEEEGP